MIKKTIVLLEVALVILLALLLLQQVTAPQGTAKRLAEGAAGFLRPWRPAPGVAGHAASQADGSADASTYADKTASTRRGLLNYRYILQPSPELDAIIADLERRDLESIGPVLVPAVEPPKPAPPRKKPKPAKPKPPVGPLRLTSLAVVPNADGALLKGKTSAPAERMELFTYRSPPMIILELYGTFDAFGPSVAVPDNPIFTAVSTETTKDKMRVIGWLKPVRAYVAPVTRSESADDFAVGMTLSPANQPNFELPRSGAKGPAGQ